jgi:hypothetical protein
MVFILAWYKRNLKIYEVETDPFAFHIVLGIMLVDFDTQGDNRPRDDEIITDVESHSFTHRGIGVHSYS